MTKLLFVCLGNICRSPAGEAVMTKLVEEKGLSDSIWCDSAGTSGWHQGEKADARMREHGMRRGYAVTSLSRQVIFPDDFETFDFILAMDSQNERDLKKLDHKDLYAHKIHQMTAFCTHSDIDHVPDPYYGGVDGFEHVLDIVEDACEGLLSHLLAQSHKS